jgi:hypothetical protein
VVPSGSLDQFICVTLIVLRVPLCSHLCLFPDPCEYLLVVPSGSLVQLLDQSLVLIPSPL